MEKNYDANIVVMDSKQYQALAMYAAIGSGELNADANVRTILRHVRRFNPDIAKIASENRAAQRARYRKRRNATISLLNRLPSGSDVYVMDLTETFCTRATLVGRSFRDKAYVRVQMQSRLVKSPRRDISINRILEAPPTGWVFDDSDERKNRWMAPRKVADNE